MEKIIFFFVLRGPKKFRNFRVFSEISFSFILPFLFFRKIKINFFTFFPKKFENIFYFFKKIFLFAPAKKYFFQKNPEKYFIGLNTMLFDKSERGRSEQKIIFFHKKFFLFSQNFFYFFRKKFLKKFRKFQKIFIFSFFFKNEIFKNFW